MDARDFFHNRTEPNYYSNYPLKEGCFKDREYFLISKGLWEYLYAIYNGTEIKRYAIKMNMAGTLDREPELIKVSK
jgi:hypothetical protein